MPDAPEYNEAVRRLFAETAHGGDLKGDFERVLGADVSESAEGARLVLAAGISGDAVAAMAFRARGCPHLVAAAEAACAALENRPVADLEKFAPDDINVELDIPVTKTGRILLLEDAVAMLWARYTGSTD